MNINTRIKIERFIYGEIEDGFSRDHIIEEVIDIYGNEASEEDLTDLVYDVFERFE
ncbi:MAG: hypothetical protein J1F35_08305 [Erysipelotrichales bacterium]|nr:hypothetical protein [Erysipelotrichales bacterium]